MADRSRAEVRQFSGYLEPVPFFVHYTFGDIAAPGLVDLSSLRFSTPIVQSFAGAANASVIDIVLFQLPSDLCSPSNAGCDSSWTTLGVGKLQRNHNKNNNNNNNNRDGASLLWCCTALDYKNGRCDGPVNRMIIDRSIFQGQLRSIDIPGPLVAMKGTTVEDPIVRIPFNSDATNTTAPTNHAGSASGRYVLAMANCNPNGRLIQVEGTYAFQSKSGYLPSDSIGVMHLFFALVAAYSLLLAVWIGHACYYSHINGTATIATTATPNEHRDTSGHALATAATSLWMLPQRLQPIHRWILITIVLGWLEAILRSFDYSFWNSHGTRTSSLLYSAVVMGVSKHTLSRCLLVMVSLGWGVIRHPTMVAPPTASAPANANCNGHETSNSLRHGPCPSGCGLFPVCHNESNFGHDHSLEIAKLYQNDNDDNDGNGTGRYDCHSESLCGRTESIVWYLDLGRHVQNYELSGGSSSEQELDALPSVANPAPCGGGVGPCMEHFGPSGSALF